MNWENIVKEMLEVRTVFENYSVVERLTKMEMMCLFLRRVLSPNDIYVTEYTQGFKATQF